MSIRLLSRLAAPLHQIPAFQNGITSATLSRALYERLLTRMSFYSESRLGTRVPKNTYTRISSAPNGLLGGLFGFALGVLAVWNIRHSSQSIKSCHTGDQDAKIETPSDDPSLLCKNVALQDTSSSIKEEQYQPTIPKKDLYVLGGNAEVLDRVADTVRYLQNPEAFVKLGAKLPKGIILSGPPGVGKTLLAEAVAGHAGVPFILINGGEMERPFAGQAEAKLREFFKMADTMAPCVVCIDEIDAIGSKRDPTSPMWANSITSQLLTLLSQDHPGVIVMATTNFFKVLDPALVRPGRFDRHIVLSLPNLADREHILKIHTKDKKLSSNVSLKDLAALSAGFSGAKLAAWVNEAAICAIRQESIQIEEQHFEEARTLLSVGILRQSSPNPLQKQRTATHEAGHALVGHLLNRRIYRTTTRSSGNSAGHTEWIPLGDDLIPTKQELLDSICMLLAGRAAEQLFETPQAGSESDLEQAKEIAYRMVSDEAMGSTISGDPRDVEEILQEQMHHSCTLLKENRETWERVKNALIEHDELFRGDFLNVIEGKSVVSKKNFFWQRKSQETPKSLPPRTKPDPKHRY